MSKLISRISAFGAVGFLALGLSACGGIPSDAVVQVNGKPITKQVFKHWTRIYAVGASASSASANPVMAEPPTYSACVAHQKAIASKPAKGSAPPTEAALRKVCEQQYKSAQQQALKFLITSEWVLSEASSRGVRVTDNEVKKQFNTIRQQQFPKEADFRKLLNKTQETVSDVLLRVKLQVVAAKLQTKVTEKAKAVSTAAASGYYNQHRANYGSPEKRNLLIVLTKTQAQAKAAKREIASGKSFKSVAKRVSIDPVSKTAGGVLNGIGKGEEEKALDTAVFAAKVGVLSGPINTPFGYYIFEVKKVMPATQQTFAETQTQIKQTLASEGEKNAMSNFVKEFKQRWKKRTQCRPQFMVGVCNGAPKATSTSQPSTAQTTAPTTTTVPTKTSTASKRAKKK
ncbi:MAG TPA: peptidyl-prolyl cis-trans isomerase [Solirubrobacteraceae bacterium]